MDYLYGAKGAFYYGLLTSFNCFVVIVGTPVLTRIFQNYSETIKLILGQFFVFGSRAMYIFVQGMLSMYFVSMFFMTIGEIFNAISAYPYLTKRIPASHRGRFASIHMLFGGGGMYYSKWRIGKILNTENIVYAWKSVAVAGLVGCFFHIWLAKADKKIHRIVQKINFAH